MSAYIVHDATINALISFAAHCRYSPGYRGADGQRRDVRSDPHEAARVLYRENVRSVTNRYSDKAAREMGAEEDFTFKETLADISPVWLLKACDCLEYQSCETDDYRQTPAFDLLDSIRGAAIHALPGYDDAPWGLDPEHVKSERVSLLSLVGKPRGGGR